MSHWHPTLQDPRYEDEPLTWYHTTQVQDSPENGECAIVERSHPHTTHRESFTPTTDKLQSWRQPGRTFKTLGRSRRVMGSQVYPRKPRPAPAMNVIMETLLFCDGNWLQSTRTQLWLQWGRHLWPTLGPRCDRQPLSAKAPSQDHPCVGTVGEGVVGRAPPSPCMAGAKWESPRWETSPAHSKLHVAGQAVGSRRLKSRFKANWKQPLLMLWRYETIIGGLNPFQGEISCQVWVIAQRKAGVMCKWVINIKRWRWETYNGMSDKP